MTGLRCYRLWHCGPEVCVHVIWAECGLRSSYEHVDQRTVVSVWWWTLLFHRSPAPSAVNLCPGWRLWPACCRPSRQLRWRGLVRPCRWALDQIRSVQIRSDQPPLDHMFSTITGVLSVNIKRTNKAWYSFIDASLLSLQRSISFRNDSRTERAAPPPLPPSSSTMKTRIISATVSNPSSSMTATRGSAATAQAAKRRDSKLWSETFDVRLGATQPLSPKEIKRQEVINSSLQYLLCVSSFN